MTTLEPLLTAADAGPAPVWLAARRAAAATAAAARGLPTSAEEVWRYSLVDQLDLGRFAPPDLAASAPAGPEPAAAAAGLGLTDPAAVVTLVDGRLAAVELSDAARAAGLEIVSATGLGDEGAELLGPPPEPDADAFVLANEALAPDPVIVRLPAGKALAGPVLVQAHAATAGVLASPRLVVVVGDDAELRVVELATSAAGAAVLTLPVTTIRVGPYARATHIAVQDLDLAAWQIGSLRATVGASGHLASTTLGLGGGYARLRTDCRLEGRGSSCRLDAGYFGEAEQVLDFRTFQDHRAPDTTSDLLYKGAVAGHSRSIYTGLIRVGREARGTQAFQTNRNLKLSDDAWAESVPNLEIQTNDVQCSHASAVGPIDEDQRFYLESRGIPPERAERLIVAGFFDQVLDRLAVPGLAAALRLRFEAKLDREGIGVRTAEVGAR